MTARDLAFALTVVALVAVVAAGEVIHVSPSGDDTAGGTAEAPMKTLAAALAKAKPGDVIELAAGEYQMATPKTPFAGRLVTIRAARRKQAATSGTLLPLDKLGVSRQAEAWHPGDPNAAPNAAHEKVTLTGFQADYEGQYSYLRFEGLDIGQCIRIHKAKWVQFVRCRITGSSHWGVGLIESEHCGLYGCVVATDTGSQCMMSGLKHCEYRYNEITRGTADAFQGNGDDLLIEGNWVHGMRKAKGAHPDGIQLGNTRRLTIRGNVFDCPDMQTFFFAWTARQKTYENIRVVNNVCTTAQVHGLTANPSGDLMVVNNLFIAAPQHKYGVANISSMNLEPNAHVVVKNNIFHMIGMGRRAGSEFGHNLVLKRHWAKGNYGTTAELTTPEALFVNRAKQDYRLKADSPAVGAADPAAAPKTDILGRPRPTDKPCMGPIERLDGDDKPFLDMWEAHFRRMQQTVTPPDPPAAGSMLTLVRGRHAPKPRQERDDQVAGGP